MPYTVRMIANQVHPLLPDVACIGRLFTLLVLGFILGCGDATPPSTTNSLEVPAPAVPLYDENDDAYRVLALVPVSGPAAHLGKYIINGGDLYTRDHPDSDILIEVIDSESNPKVAVNELEAVMEGAKLRKRPYPNIVVSALSSVAEPVIEACRLYELFTIITMTTSSTVIEGRRNVQRINQATADHVEPIALYAQSKFRKVAILYSFESSGIANKDIFISTFLSQGHQFYLYRYSLREDNVQPLVQEVISRNPEAVYVTGYGPTYLNILQTLYTEGFEGQVLSDGSLAPQDVLNMEKDLRDSGEFKEDLDIIFTGTELELSEPRTESARDFRDRYFELYGYMPIYNAAFAYDALAIIDTIQVTLQGQQVMTQGDFRKLKTWQGVVSDIDFLAGGECKVSMFAIRYDGKQFLPADL